MKLDNANSIFNMGDTSIRVKRQVEIYHFLMQQMQEFETTGATWECNNTAQESFYVKAHAKITELAEENYKLFDNFNRHYEPPKETQVGKRARTWTNALVKNGLLTNKRTISQVGQNYLNNTLTPADKLERLLTTDVNNLLYMRQYLKMRIFAHTGDYYFYNFRFAIKFLTRYQDVPNEHFLRIVLSISPIANQNLDDIIDGYIHVKSRRMSFERYYNQFFQAQLFSKELQDKVHSMLTAHPINKTAFEQCFPNRKSSRAVDIYYQFVEALYQFKKNQNQDTLNTLKAISRLSEIKKGFGFGTIPFVFSNRNQTVDDFLQNNKDNILLQNELVQTFYTFHSSKRYDLIKEYSDMCVRSFRTTGLISFDNGLVNLQNRWFFEILFSHAKDYFELAGVGNFEDYEQNEQSDWFLDVSLIEILKIDEDVVNDILHDIQMRFGLENLDKIEAHLEKEKEKAYRDFIEQTFPKDKVIKILNHITQREDDQVAKEVTDNATIPTIFEYILTIAWYHLSKQKDYQLHKSFCLTLDGNKLPLSHRAGGAGDIEILTNSYSLLIEATLMDSNTQKRGELEPVIRHSINFKIDNMDRNKPIQTLFVANELDSNVVNIFRSMQWVELNGTKSSDKRVDGVDIFALSTAELVALLEHDISDTQILQHITSNASKKPEFVKNNWRDDIFEHLLAI